MHGVKRANYDTLQTKSVSVEELQEIESYKLLIKEFNELYFSQDKDNERILECTRNILTRNPEYYTAWNERKRALTRLPCIGIDQIKMELMINVLAIKANPKSYSAWFHRRWFIENYCKEAKEAIVSGELELLNKLLDLDCRNFHGWNYRIWLSNWANLSILDEFDFTTLKIYQNFSNYTAWQRRSHLFPKYLESFGGNVVEFLRNEVEMCRNAAWTEPADQSVWFYQRWLFLELPRLRPDLKELCLNELARDQVKSINELIKEESGNQSSVPLAKTFLESVSSYYTQ